MLKFNSLDRLYYSDQLDEFLVVNFNENYAIQNDCTFSLRNITFMELYIQEFNFRLIGQL